MLAVHRPEEKGNKKAFFFCEVQQKISTLVYLLIERFSKALLEKMKEKKSNLNKFLKRHFLHSTQKKQFVQAWNKCRYNNAAGLKFGENILKAQNNF